MRSREKFAAATKDADLGSVIATLKASGRWIAASTSNGCSEAANDLVAKPGQAWCWPVRSQPVVVQLIVYGINSALKNLGQTLVVREFPRNPRTNSILQLATDINGGRIKQLFILGGDPVYNAQSAVWRRIARQNSRSIGSICKKRCPKWCVSVITRTRLRR